MENNKIDQLKLEILKTKATAFDKYAAYEAQLESARKSIQDLGGFIGKIAKELGLPEDQKPTAEDILDALQDLKDSTPQVVAAA
jgi:hypothetical protein